MDIHLKKLNGIKSNIQIQRGDPKKVEENL
jgi:hypothetical protein